MYVRSCVCVCVGGGVGVCAYNIFCNLFWKCCALRVYRILYLG